MLRPMEDNSLKLTDLEISRMPAQTVDFYRSVEGSRFGNSQLDFLRRYREGKGEVWELVKIGDFLLRFWVWRAKNKIQSMVHPK